MAESKNHKRGDRIHKNSPLLSSSRKYGLTSEKSSLSGSFEAPKCYGATKKPLPRPCDYKLVRYELEEGDTLQGLAIKFGVSVQELKRINKLWTNDNIHIYKTLKIPVKVDSQFYHWTSDSSVQTGQNATTDKQLPGVGVQDMNHTSNERGNNCEDSTGKDIGNKASTLSFLSSLDARIQNSKQESEKLRTVTGPRVLADLEKVTEPSMPQDEFLFRPLTHQTGNYASQFLTSGRPINKSKTALNAVEDQFFEL